MKRVFIAAFAFTAATASFAQTSTTPEATPAATETATPAAAATEIAPAKEEDERKAVRLEDLPAPVKTELSTVQYKGWTPSVAYWVREGKTEYYEITMVMGDESKKVKYNAEGSKLD